MIELGMTTNLIAVTNARRKPPAIVVAIVFISASSKNKNSLNLS